jgi:hypothetical protein
MDGEWTATRPGRCSQGNTSLVSRSVRSSVGFKDGLDVATSFGAPVVTRSRNFIAYSVGCLENLKYQKTIPTAHETAICRNPHNSSNLDFRIIIQFGYKHSFCQNVIYTNKLLVRVFS